MLVLALVRPDVLIVDISLNGPDGLDLLKNIRISHPKPAGADPLHA
jgi:DNA-binding NarL/FixJ family response regulator